MSGGYSTDADGNEVTVTSAEAWDPKTGTWGPADPPHDADYPAGTLLDDGRILVISDAAVNTGYGSATVWDPVTRSSTPTGSFEPGVALGTATRLSDGRVLFAGGGWPTRTCMTTRADGTCHGAAFGYHPIVAAAIWDPATGLFSPTGPLSHERYGAAATLLADGRVLIVGSNGVDEGDAAELFELK